jgi:hypothetical protein
MISDGEEMELMGLRALLVVICATAEVFFISCALGLFRDLRRNQGGGDVRPLRESKE